MIILNRNGFNLFGLIELENYLKSDTYSYCTCALHCQTPQEFMYFHTRATSFFMVGMNKYLKKG